MPCIAGHCAARVPAQQALLSISSAAKCFGNVWQHLALLVAVAPGPATGCIDRSLTGKAADALAAPA